MHDIIREAEFKVVPLTSCFPFPWVKRKVVTGVLNPLQLVCWLSLHKSLRCEAGFWANWPHHVFCWVYQSLASHSHSIISFYTLRWSKPIIYFTFNFTKIYVSLLIMLAISVFTTLTSHVIVLNNSNHASQIINLITLTNELWSTKFSFIIKTLKMPLIKIAFNNLNTTLWFKNNFLFLKIKNYLNFFNTI